ncbi:farnesyl-diphosphate farnesyltransferase [Haloferax volcanii DS2]|uniref:Farnesyl-diphosphate farnesyltransferase n=1 Tax=Haloferax volcanii (strain ATCC 29605 / DSM 3757 / JCM 8879 / NBRC 14742 / NCIMB 2012 / VKM B-1768 / DS2) TaxID=309800 RepID=L9UTW5_HALVD|nr:farnesyl-diphosphate farnesyltransferase [Haloferax volcanii DS2]
MASHICIGYLLCRIADTVEDSSSIAPDEQAHLLRLYDRALDSDDDTTVDEFVAAVQPHLPPEGEQSDDWMVVANTARVFRTFEALPEDVREAVTPPVRELVSGMAMFVERYSQTGGLRIQSREELEEYCYYAAGTVGNLITNLVTRGNVDSERRSRLYDTAEEFGLLLQLVNIAKDVHDDYTSENNVYLPADWLDDAGVPQEEGCLLYTSLMARGRAIRDVYKRQHARRVGDSVPPRGRDAPRTRRQPRTRGDGRGRQNLPTGGVRRRLRDERCELRVARRDARNHLAPAVPPSDDEPRLKTTPRRRSGLGSVFESLLRPFASSAAERGG